LADIKQRFQSTFAATVSVLAVLLTNVTALPARTLAQRDGPMCKVEAQAHHSIGGGSTTQAPPDVVTGALICYDSTDKMVWTSMKVIVMETDGAVATVSAADCRTHGDVSVATALDSGANHYTECRFTYNGVVTEGKKHLCVHRLWVEY
jgi:hypothetical protein